VEHWVDFWLLKELNTTYKNRIMKNIQTLLTVILVFVSLQVSMSQELFLYKEVDTTKLFMEVIYPDNLDPTQKYPALVFFFGGGWVGGTRAHFGRQAAYFAKRGLVCFMVDYRTKNQHQTTPFESLKDAKSAIRYLRKNASEFYIVEW
jgi:acetyl esterase/lipase